MTTYEIPLSSQPEKFTIQLGQISYQLTVHYANVQDGGWLLDIADVDGNPMANGLPLVTGHDLLAQYAYLGIAGELVVQSDVDIYAIPTFTNLGSEAHLYFIAS